MNVLDPNQPSTSRPVRSVAFETEQIAAATLRLKVARRKAKLDKRAAELEELAKAKRDAALDPANVAAAKVFADKIKKVMRRIERNYPRCHPVPEPSPPRVTSTMLRGFVEAAASGLITDQLQPNPNHPHVAARLRQARSGNPVPVEDDDENDDSTQPGNSSEDGV